MKVFRDTVLRVPQIRRLYQERNTLRNELTQLVGKLSQAANSPFLHYNASFDPQEVIRRHAVSGLTARADALTNFLGVVINPAFVPTILRDRAGQIEDIPIPANWHADIAEWGAALRAVDLATGSFTVVELGCGWGCWINNTGVAARRLGLAVHLVGVEGDAAHLASAMEAGAANGFAPEQLTLHHGIAAATAGTALFPRQAQSGVDWGRQPILAATEDQRRSTGRSGGYDELPMIALADVMAPHHRIDLLHVDIQGGEADLVDGGLAVLCEKVAYLVIGTHSRPIEGRLIDSLLQAGWRLEIERPAIFVLDHTGVPQVTVDGVQGWRNPALAAK